jgi:hypothetical protein
LHNAQYTPMDGTHDVYSCFYHTVRYVVSFRHALILSTLLFGVLATAAGVTRSPRTINATRTPIPPRLDGVPTDSCWQLASPSSGFTQYDPVEGAAPTEETTVRLLYDDHALYVGVICYDRNPKGIVSQLSRRDRSTEADRFTVMIDSYYDHTTGFVFSTNVSGVQSDGVLSQAGYVYDIAWDAVWNVKTARGSWGWSAEYMIPWSALRFAERTDSSYEWGINFRRYISRKKEIIEWVMVPRSEYYTIPLWGTLRGIRDIRTPMRLEIAPYVSGMQTSTTGNTGITTPATANLRAGLDVKYGLARNFTLDATINPDFGQVEVDEAVLNLTVFETLYPEKRPFFLEGSQMFTFGGSGDNSPLTLFFSRRIGREPSGSSSVIAPTGGAIEENPRATTILGAAKLTGRTSTGLSVAVLTALTDEEHATLSGPAGMTSVVTEPMASYNVLRLKQDSDEGSWYGGMFTLAARDRAHPAVSGGVDWNLHLLDGKYTADGYLAGARAYSGNTPQTGGAGRLLLLCVSADHWFPAFSYDFYTPGFSINEMGFFAQPHDHGGYFQLVYRENNASGLFRRYYLGMNPELRWNWDDGVRTRTSLRFEGIGELQNFWHLDLTCTRQWAAYEDKESGVLGLYRHPGSDAIALSVISDERHILSGSILAGLTIGDAGERSKMLSASLTLRPTSWMDFSPTVTYQRVTNAVAWLYPDGNAIVPDASVFGTRNLEYLDVSVRGIVTFTRTLSVQFFLQSLAYRGKYRDYGVLQRDGTLEPFLSLPDGPDIANHDFNSVFFNANVLLRWEYLPGSTLYLVWTQGRYGNTDDYSTNLGRRLGDTWTLPRTDTFVLKANYWFSL